MKQSLREKLNLYIRQKGTVSWLEVKEICETGKFGRTYKLSNAERRLRQSESPDVEAIEEHGHIVSYRWRGKPLTYKLMRVAGTNQFVKIYDK